MDAETLRRVFLACLQGLTEFLPISSSAHLILPAELLGWQDQGLAFDVAVHFGSLLAVLAYFRRDLSTLISACCRHVFYRQASDESRLGWMLVLASLPLVLGGWLLKDLADQALRSNLVIAASTLAFGLLLWLADKVSTATRSIRGLNWRDCLLIGCAQVLAVIPGTSRSGITMTAALFCHLDRESASRFSFLLAIPAISGASLLLGLDLLESGTAEDWRRILLGMAVSALVAYLCIHFFLRLIQRIGFKPFVIYRIVLSSVLFAFFVS